MLRAWSLSSWLKSLDVLVVLYYLRACDFPDAYSQTISALECSLSVLVCEWFCQCMFNGHHMPELFQVSLYHSLWPGTGIMNYAILSLTLNISRDLKSSMESFIAFHRIRVMSGSANGSGKIITGQDREVARNPNSWRKAGISELIAWLMRGCCYCMYAWLIV